jgi:hypothetical protein
MKMTYRIPCCDHLGSADEKHDSSNFSVGGDIDRPAMNYYSWMVSPRYEIRSGNKISNPQDFRIDQHSTSLAILTCIGRVNYRL